MATDSLPLNRRSSSWWIWDGNCGSGDIDGGW